jgi:polyhydroxybutyrate depolymerase
VPVGDSVRTIAVDGARRSFRVHRPEELPSAAPLVVVVHGGFGSSEQAEESYGWDAVADREGFVVAYPDGLGRAWNVGGGCCGRPGRTGTDDVAFVTALVAALDAEVSLDPRRVYATGISNGGMLAYRLACDSDVFAAIGPVAATRLGGCNDPAPVSVIHIHGLADHAVPYDGRPGEGVAHIDGPPVADVVADWRRVDRCDPPVAATRTVVTTETAHCPLGREVELVTIAGAGHQWPGGQPHSGAERLGLVDPPSRALDATEVVWEFFRDHPAPDGQA